MKLFLVLASDDAETTCGLFDNFEAAKTLCEAAKDTTFDLITKEYEINKKSDDDIYYFVIDENEYEVVDECFTTKEEALKYVKNNNLSSFFEIHGHKINSIYDGNTSLDENGILIKPADDELEYSLYNAYNSVKAKYPNTVWFEYIYIEEE